MDLDKEQSEAVAAEEPSIAITAGPGSGKTRTVVERIAHLVQRRGVPPDRVLAVTFTNKAAREVRRRLAEKVSGALPHVHTFHSFALELVRRHAGRAGLAEDVRVLTEKEQRTLIAAIAKDIDEMGLREALKHISRAKAHGDRIAKSAKEGELLSAYDAALRSEGKMDFDDILIFAFRILSEHEDVRCEYAGRYAHILIDEFQDTNMLQMKIVLLITEGAEGICVIGDPKQAIYGFRGGLTEAFAMFKTAKPSTREIALAKNYRSTVSIQAVAAALFDPDAASRMKDDNAERVRMVACATAREEAAYVAREIVRLTGGLDMNGAGAGEGYHLGDIAIIYRLNAVARECEKELEIKGIPYCRSGKSGFFDRREIKTVLDRLRRAPADLPLTEALEACIEEAYRNDPEKRTRAFELFSITEPYAALAPLEARAALFAEAELSREEDDGPGAGEILLLTAHAAKGLEFKVVFVVGCEDELFPFSPEGESDTDIEEERRLLYVALTRAKERLYIMRAKSRTLFGVTRENGLSRFLANLPGKFIEKETIRPRERKKAPQARLF